jgi:hypothetical protein
MVPAVSLFKACVVSMDGRKRPWIIKQRDVKTADDQEFVKLCTRSSALSSLAGNHGGYLCLGRSNGYHELVQLRNDQAFSAEPACSLFDGETSKKKAKPTKDQSKRAADHKPTMEIVLHMNAVDYKVKLLRPLTPTDAIFAAFEQDTIATILQWIQTKGFKDANPKRKQRSSELPKGVYEHPKGFLVSYTDSDGSRKRKFKPELSQALSFRADPTQDNNDDDSDDDDDDESQGDDVEDHANAAGAAGSGDHPS